MPINDKQQAFINEYRINGHNATKAYKAAYPGCKSGHKQAGARLLTNVDIKQAISKDMAENKAETGRTVQSLDNMYQQAYDLAASRGDPNTNSMNGSVTGLARLYGLDKDVHIDAEVSELALAEQAAAKELAAVILRDRLKLSKPA